nr:AAA family ATPase [Kibdelosporangium sp. MJ126-NF4]CEL21764.1 putative transcriptional regulator [Kibdelosporangium sp. MJ126-NF4]CTQ92544.1 putative transcriptional regulator [Kibdelosporangium sp. MJ126-NF4]
MDEIIGRGRDLALISRALSPDTAGPRVLVVLGDPGIGKTALINAVVRRAREQGDRVLRVCGSEAEHDLPFAGLHELLLPVLDHMERLPHRQRTALRNAFGEGDEPAQPDKMVINLAVLTLLSDVADAGPLLLVADDAHWLDPGTCDVLAFLARRLAGEPIALLMAARGTLMPPRVDSHLPKHVLRPLSAADAERVLDLQPDPPTGPVRSRILTEAAGNPLALVELAKAVTRDSGAQRGTTDLPLTELLERTFAAHVTELPEATRHALVIAATADNADLSVVQAALGSQVGADVWAPAERAGLVRIDHGRIEFRHPLVRSAIYGGVPFGTRREAHLALAAVLDDAPDRQAWHLSAATVSPDETVAAALDAAAGRAYSRGAVVEAIHGLRRAGELSPDPGDHGTRLAKAAVIAVISNDMELADELVRKAAELTDDPEALVWITQMTGLSASYRMRMDQAFTLAFQTAEAPEQHGGPSFSAVVVAALAAYYTGRADYREQMLAVLPRFRTVSDDNQPYLLLGRAAVNPFVGRAEITARLHDVIVVSSSDPGVLDTVGMLAWMLDETEIAICQLDQLANPAREDASAIHGGMAAANLAWAYLDAGNWADAHRSAEKLAFSGEATLGTARTLAVEATLSALSGATDRARQQAADLLAMTEPSGIVGVSVRARWALGMASVADGDQDTAYRHLRSLFDSSGGPVHYHWSYYGIADLAAAARSVSGHDVVSILDNAVVDVGALASPRLSRILHRAKALLADTADAEEHFRAALADTADNWPFERAQSRLDYGEWLRRQRRISEARANLSAALASFERLGAVAWTERARTELRAAGVAVNPGKPTALDALSPQRQQIVRLAAEGLTNKEIGERLYLSHRTVGFHLYKAFPALGVTTRAQLRDAIR